MKKYLFLPACAMLLTMASCTDDPDQPANTIQFNCSLPTFVIPDGATEDSQVLLPGNCSYIFTQDYYTSKWVLKAQNISLPGYNTLNFTSPELYGNSGYNVLLTYPNSFQADKGDEINNLMAIVSEDYYYYTGDNSITMGLPLSTLTAISFDVKGQYRLRAFPILCYYGGEVVSSYSDASGTPKHYKASNVQFGIKLNTSTGTADVTVHNARFAEEMPMTISYMSLSGLKIEGDAEYGYRITGKDIVPIVGAGANGVPYPDFKFTEFEMHPSENSLTKCEIEFEVANKFTGEFNGSFTK